MSHLYCIICNLGSLVAIAWLGHLVCKGASVWLVIVMLMLSMHLVVPGNDIFTCPSCGHTDKVKVFRAYLPEEHIAVQNEKEGDQ